MREAARVLEPGGRYCFAMRHPLNTAGAFTSRDPDAPFVIEGSYFERTQKEMPVQRDGLEMTFLDLRELRDDGDPDDSRGQRLPLFLHVRAVRR